MKVVVVVAVWLCLYGSSDGVVYVRWWYGGVCMEVLMVMCM